MTTGTVSADTAGEQAGAYVLDRTPPPPYAVPRLDPAQQAVVDHSGGPLLVLAGPGTGKTTTLVEAVAARVARGLRPDEVLVLTFSRKAADELRDRISRRLDLAGTRASTEPAAWTFHAWCLALLRAHPEEMTQARLLSGPERLVRVRDLVRGQLAGEGATRWPVPLRPALGTRGFARELADLLDRARERGLEPGDLADVAARAGRADWAAAAGFYAEYVDVLGLSGELDYGELVRQALRLVEDRADVLAGLRRRYPAVFVDEYQDTDPAQERMLQLLAGGGGDLVVVGDPDQAIYGFRGAEVGCLLRFPQRFRQADRHEAPTLALQVSRRAGAALLEVSRRVAARVPTPGLPVRSLVAHRALRPAESTADRPMRDGNSAGCRAAAQVRLFATAADEATAIADLLRRERLEEGLAWERMAVLVRSGTRSLPVLRRALTAAGVPVAVAADEVPVAHDPAVAPLLLALRVADDPDRLDVEATASLLLSPLGRATPAGLRRLGRALRAQERSRLAAEAATVDVPTVGLPTVGLPTVDPSPVHAAGVDLPGVDLPGPAAPTASRLPRPSAELLRAALAQPGELLLLDDADQRWARPVVRVAALVRSAREVLATGGGADEALWAIWERSRLGDRLARAAAGGGRAGRSADRDLDAVVALFDELGSLVERVPRASVGVLLDTLDAQEIPSAARVEGRLAAAGAVRLLTAHRAKGLEWDVVVVAGVQEGSWPDLRRRGSLLEGDRLTADGSLTAVAPAPTTGSLLVDERRLFYVALTRARHRLVLTAVDSADDDGDRPSRFLDETGLAVPAHPESPPASLSTSALTGRMRRALLGGGRDDPRDAEAAAACLAALAPHVAAAHPSRWWGMLDWTPGAAPVRPLDQPVALSGSSVSSYETCPLAWFFQHEVRAAAPQTGAQGFGLAVHALARLVAEGAVPADVDAVMSRLDTVWGGLGFDAPWYADRERHEARAALERFLRWQAADRGRTWVASELGFSIDWSGRSPEDNPVAARLRGSMDRVERDHDGRLHVVDLKTGKTPPLDRDVPQHPQLGVYQVAVRQGAAGDGAPGGAELLHLRTQVRGGAKAQAQPALTPDDPWADELLGRVVAGVAAERFPARPTAACDRCTFRRACPAQETGEEVVR